MVLQYVDDTLLCGPSEELSSQATHALLNFLKDGGYEFSTSKAHLCRLDVKYFGLSISKGIQKLWEEKIKPVLAFLQSKSLK